MDISRVWVAAVLAIATGCGGGGSSPEDQCVDFLEVTCDRVIECVPSSGTKSACIAELSQTIVCSRTRMVGPTYSSCMSHMDNDSCAVLFPTDPATNMPKLALPSDCSGVILQATSSLPDDDLSVPINKP